MKNSGKNLFLAPAPVPRLAPAGAGASAPAPVPVLGTSLVHTYVTNLYLIIPASKTYFH